MSWNIIQRIREGQKVPTADATTNVYVNDATGNKTDAAVTTAGTTKSVMAYVKGLVGLHAVPTADATTNTYMRDVVGIKTDAEVAAVGTTKTLMAYLKGLVRELDQRSTSASVCATSNTNSYADVVNITNKGVLTGVAQRRIYTTAVDYSHLKIIIDGATVLDTAVDAGGNAFFTQSNATVDAYNSLAFNHRFNTSLQIQHKCLTADRGSVQTWVSYTTDA